MDKWRQSTQTDSRARCERLRQRTADFGIIRFAQPN
jgi:hypothetical protein